MSRIYDNWVGAMVDPEAPRWHHLRPANASSLFYAALSGTHALSAHPRACADPSGLVHAAAEFALARPRDRVTLLLGAHGLSALWTALETDHALGRRGAPQDAPFVPVKAAAVFAVATRAVAAGWWVPDPASEADEESCPSAGDDDDATAAADEASALDAAVAEAAPSGLRLLSALASPRGPAGFAVIRPGGRRSTAAGNSGRTTPVVENATRQDGAADDAAATAPPAYADGVPSFWLHPVVAARLAARSLSALGPRNAEIADGACEALEALLSADWCVRIFGCARCRVSSAATPEAFGLSIALPSCLRPLVSPWIIDADIRPPAAASEKQTFSSGRRKRLLTTMALLSRPFPRHRPSLFPSFKPAARPVRGTSGGYELAAAVLSAAPAACETLHAASSRRGELESCGALLRGMAAPAGAGAGDAVVSACANGTEEAKSLLRRFLASTADFDKTGGDGAGGPLPPPAGGTATEQQRQCVCSSTSGDAARAKGSLLPSGSASAAGERATGAAPPPEAFIAAAVACCGGGAVGIQAAAVGAPTDGGDDFMSVSLRVLREWAGEAGGAGEAWEGCCCVVGGAEGIERHAMTTMTKNNGRQPRGCGGR